VKILRGRPTRSFVLFLVRCHCGQLLGHRSDRPVIVCYSCGRTEELRRAAQRHRRQRRTDPSDESGSPNRDPGTEGHWARLPA
jgi:hypothetical protein